MACGSYGGIMGDASHGGDPVRENGYSPWLPPETRFRFDAGVRR